MCGYFGVISKNEISEEKVITSDKFLICRGPDDHRWSRSKIKNKKILNSFHRLSILDLSDEANQPMISKQFETEIMFNGEIYNHLDLRNKLEKNGHTFKTSHSDTETLLIGLSVYGKEFIQQLDGQFSIIFINKKESKILLIRDRLGQKPLFYSISKGELIYSSNLKSIISYKKKFELDSKQVATFLELNAIPSPNTLDININKLRPAEYIEISLENLSVIEKNIYWNFNGIKKNNIFDKDEFYRIFNNSVEKRLISDVPLASLISGGIDSSAIIKSLNSLGVNPINTFSIYNKNKKYDESYWIKKVVNKFKTQHNYIEIDGSNLNVNPIDIIKEFDEPYADPSIIPSYIIYKEISKNYKVALSGDGGDELLGGYEKIHLSLKISFLPKTLGKLIFRLFPARFGTGGSLNKFYKSPEFSYLKLTTDTKLLNLLNFKSNFQFEKNYFNESLNTLKKLMLSDYNFYFSELMLLKIDRTSMANSLEIRSPFLDHKLIEYVVSSDMTFFDVKNPKKLLKDYLKSDFENEFLDRKKKGFVFDLETWIYKNENSILKIIEESEIFKIVKIKKLFKYKSRINAIRIFKILIISQFIKDYREIANS